VLIVLTEALGKVAEISTVMQEIEDGIPAKQPKKTKVKRGKQGSR